MRLVLIRHGQTEWNLERRIQGWLDSPLTKEGISQLGRIKLPSLTKPKVICSDLGRATSSAKIIAAALAVELETDSRLRERKLGMLEGKVIDADSELSVAWDAYHHRYSRKMEGIFGVETEIEFENRILHFIHELIAMEPESDIVIVSHGEWIRALHNLYCHTPSWHLGNGIEKNAVPLVIDWHDINAPKQKEMA